MNSGDKKPIYVLNGPNLGQLGRRLPEIYGTTTLARIEAGLIEQAGRLGLKIVFRQSNHEGDLVDWIIEAGELAAGIIINPAAYSHTSIAVRDAVEAVGLPVIEVHLSDISKREPFRRHSYVSDVADEIVMGLGAEGYSKALDALTKRLQVERKTR